MTAGATYPVTIQAGDSSGQVVYQGALTFQQSTNQPAGTNGNVSKATAIAFGTAGLTAGVALYTPAVGDLILDIGIVITTAFNGTTPKIDVGTFNGGNNGLFDELAGAPVDATKVYADVTNNAGIAAANSHLWLSSAITSVGAAGTAAINSWQLRVSAANPLLVVVSQTGAKGGTATGATAGAATIVVVTSTPS